MSAVRSTHLREPLMPGHPAALWITFISSPTNVAPSYLTHTVISARALKTRARSAMALDARDGAAPSASRRPWPSEIDPSVPTPETSQAAQVADDGPDAHSSEGSQMWSLSLRSRPYPATASRISAPKMIC